MKLHVDQIHQVTIISIREAENSSGQPSPQGIHFYVPPCHFPEVGGPQTEQKTLLWKEKADTWLLMLHGLGEGSEIDQC